MLISIEIVPFFFLNGGGGGGGGGWICWKLCLISARISLKKENIFFLFIY